MIKAEFLYWIASSLAMLYEQQTLHAVKGGEITLLKGLDLCNSSYPFKSVIVRRKVIDSFFESVFAGEMDQCLPSSIL